MKNLFIVLFFLFSVVAFSQEKNVASIMSSVICECLDNSKKEGSLKSNFDKVYKECQQAAVMTGLLSKLKEGKDTTITINTDATLDSVDQTEMNATIALLEKDCAIYNNYVVSDSALIDAVPSTSAIACECIDTISTSISQTEKNAAIKECTTNAVVEKISNDGLNLSTVDQMKTFYKKISEYMVENCPAMEKVVFSNDEEKLNSYSTNEDAMKLYFEGIDYMEAGKYKKAVKSYKNAVKLDPKFVFAWDNLGRSYRQLHEYDQAIAAYKNSYQVDSLNPTSVMNMAVAYNYKKDYKNAELWYEKLIEINPNDPEGHYGLALTFMNQQKIEESLQKAIDARAIYMKSDSPYAADAEKVIRYLYQMFQENEKVDLFKKICADNNIQLDE